MRQVTATEKLRAVNEGMMAEAEFVRQMRQLYPMHITQYNGFKDTVQILKNKGMLFEEKKEHDYAKHNNISVESLRRAIDIELEAMGLMSHGNVSFEDQEKAKNKALKNLEKDPLHYYNLISGESSKVDKHDKPTEFKKGKEVDTFNGLKKAELKENLNEASQEESVASYIIKHYAHPKTGKSMIDDEIVSDFFKTHPEWEEIADGTDEGMQRLIDTFEEYLFVNYDIPSAGDAMEEKVEEAAKETPFKSDEIKSVSFPNGLSVTVGQEHPEEDGIVVGIEKGENGYLIMFQDGEEGGGYHVDFDGEFLDEDDFIEEKVAKSVEDVIDPADYGDIGRGYLKGFNRPHSLSDDDLEVLGRKVTDKLFKGDFDAAKAKFVGEVMGIDRKGNQKPETEPSRFKGRDKSVSRAVAAEALSDEDMKAIEKYGHADKPVKAFKPGDMWSNDFDYEGMLEFGLKIRLNTPVQTLQALYDSFEDVNYHSENQHLGNAIDAIKDGDKSDALDNIRNFKKAVKQTLIGINEGGTPVRELEEGDPMTMAYTKKVKDIHERVGGLQEFISLIEDRAAESGFSEAEEAEEVIEAIKDHYSLAEVNVQELSSNNVVWNWSGDRNELEEVPPEFKAAVRAGLGDQIDDVDFEDAFDGIKNFFADEAGRGEKTFNSDHWVEMIEMDYLEEKKGKDHDGDGDVDSDDYMAAKDKAIKKAMGKDEMVRENIKAIIQKVLEEGTINEAATNNLADWGAGYEGFEGVKAVVNTLENIVTEIESFYDKIGDKIAKAMAGTANFRNDEGLKIGAFIAPSLEAAFKKDLRPIQKAGFLNKVELPKVRTITQADIDAHNSGERPLGEQEPAKQHVFTPAVNENKKK